MKGAQLTAHTHAAPDSFRLPRQAPCFFTLALHFLSLLLFLLLVLAFPFYTVALLLLFTHTRHLLFRFTDCALLLLLQIINMHMCISG